MSQVQLSLYQNGIDSIRHALEHYVEDPVETRRYKYAILHLAQGVLLLLKERLRQEHSNFIFVNVATDPASDKKIKTIDFEDALVRLKKIAGVDLESESHALLIRRLTAKRNSIEHYSVDISRQEADSIIVQTLQFLRWFVAEELKRDFKQTIGTDMWERLLLIEEYYIAEVARAKRKIADNGFEALLCTTCEENTAAVIGSPVERAHWKVTPLQADCLVCETEIRGVACLRCGKGITLNTDQLPQLNSYCEDCRAWARINFAGVHVRNNNYTYAAEVFRWFLEHDTINAHQLWVLLGNVFLAGSSAPDYPTSLYHSGVIDFVYEHHKEDFEIKINTPGYWGIMADDPYVFEWSYERVKEDGAASENEKLGDT